MMTRLSWRVTSISLPGVFGSNASGERYEYYALRMLPEILESKMPKRYKYLAARMNNALPWELTVTEDGKMVARTHHKTLADAKSAAEEIERKETA